MDESKLKWLLAAVAVLRVTTPFARRGIRWFVVPGAGVVAPVLERVAAPPSAGAATARPVVVAAIADRPF